LFTGKELDEETELYYFGARYYDPRTSVWQSVDPILGSYMAGGPNGGVYNSSNLALYAYGYLNPMKFLDPDGRLSEKSIAQLHEFEYPPGGNPPNYMYRDTTGHVTIGVGHHILNVDSAKRIKFMIDGRPATPKEISEAYKAVLDHNASLNTKATAFENVSPLRVEEGTITTLLTKDIKVAEAGAKGIFPDFDSYPESVQTSIVDMAFNLGVSKLRVEFPKFVDAVRKKDWLTAAQESHRRDIPEERNAFADKAFVGAFFEEAAKK
jgi:RHS repeat-associated protein